MNGVPMRIAILATLMVGVPALASAQAATAPLPWLTGCWRMTRGVTVVEERWGDMQGGLMLGTGRTVRNGRAVEYEFTRITLSGDTLAFHAMPSGQSPTTFAAVSHGADSVVFANPQHDFPKSVTYKRLNADSLHAWVEGNGRKFDFRYARVGC